MINFNMNEEEKEMDLILSGKTEIVDDCNQTLFNLYHYQPENKIEIDEKEEKNFSIELDLFERKKIFNISKVKKIKERKCLKDDLLRKIKSNFIHKFLLNILNELIIENFGKNYILLKIDNKIISDINIKYNIILFNKTIGELFDNKISSKYKNNKYDNHEIINIISQNNEINKILNIKLKELYECFISKNWKKEIFQKLNIDFHNKKRQYNKIINFYETIQNDKKNNNEYYQKKLIYFGETLFNHLNIIKSRRNRKKPFLTENNIFRIFD